LGLGLDFLPFRKKSKVKIGPANAVLLCARGHEQQMSDRHKNAEETKAEYVLKMGQELGPLFYALWCEVVHVNWTWNEYLELFGTKPSRLELLNKSAAFFFRTVQNVFWDNTLLHIARLTDPPKSCGKDNLSIQKLPGLVSAELRPSIQAFVAVAIEKSEFSRDWRNRHIAHKDLKLALKEELAIPLKVASREKVNEALRAIEEVLNAVSRPYTRSTSIFNKSLVSSGAEHLIYVLDDGLRMEKERFERLKTSGWDQEKDGARNL